MRAERKLNGQCPMRNIRWYVRSIGGVDPDAASASSRPVIVIARYETPGLDAHVAAHEFEVWVSAELKDLSTIEREVYHALREHLRVLLASLPGRWPRSAPRP